MIKLTFRPTSNTPKSIKSKIHFIPNSRGLGIIGLAEIALYLKLSGEFINEHGKTVSLKSMKEALETAFNFEFKDFDRKIHEVFKRKPFNLTKALDYLRNLLIREKKNREEQKMKNNTFVDY
ncbi:MAG: hypothetical protein KH117_05610 [Dysgonomonas sp.]|uniref:hypothetical protein n=1 Tax=Dysgonomonas sp. TaxID=1891233 RepID=UPI00257F58CC|nr:hypothetical protein [Dysgonomonas sp.]MBS7120460.1 hypothetical protein [Dysgonomonas sp.]